jgi:Uma2 family endonuclease
MGMPALPTDGWTVDMLATLPDDGNRYEIIDGELLVTPAPSLIHQAAVLELALRLAPYVKNARIGRVLISPADVEIAHDTMLEPDLFVVPQSEGRLPQKWRDASRLLLAVEVVSPASARADRGRKRARYQRERIPEYWIVDVDSRLVERWRPGDDRPEVLTTQLPWQPNPEGEPLSIDLVEYFRDVTGEQ